MNSHGNRPWNAELSQQKGGGGRRRRQQQVDKDNRVGSRLTSIALPKIPPGDQRAERRQHQHKTNYNSLQHSHQRHVVSTHTYIPIPIHTHTRPLMPAAANTSSTPKSPSARPAVRTHAAATPTASRPTDRRPGKKWFDCAQCHHETADHPLMQSFEMVFVCKKCKKAFRKDSREFEDR